MIPVNVGIIKHDKFALKNNTWYMIPVNVGIIKPQFPRMSSCGRYMIPVNVGIIKPITIQDGALPKVYNT